MSLELNEQLFQNLKRLVNRIEKDIKRKLANSPLGDLSLAEISIIDAIGLNGEKTIKEIAEQLDVALSTPTKTMDRLVAKGYIIRETSADDRRMVVSRLTERGNKAVLQISQARQSNILQYLNKLTEVELKQLNNIVRHILTTD
ncbi:MAG: MarR family transcriptional regulator [Dehalococcoidia bacterium]|nr:MAG: MarR family transcriptional regulator [Dehalococcoidia bacterium]